MSRKKKRAFKPLGKRDVGMYKDFPSKMASPLALPGMQEHPLGLGLTFPAHYHAIAPEVPAFIEWARRKCPSAPDEALQMFAEMAVRKDMGDAMLPALPKDVLTKAMSTRQLLMLLVLQYANRWHVVGALVGRHKYTQLAEDNASLLWNLHSRARTKKLPWEEFLYQCVQYFQMFDEECDVPLPKEETFHDPNAFLTSGEEGTEWLPFQVHRPELPKQRSFAVVGESYAGLMPKPSRAALGKLGYKCFAKKRKHKGRRIAVLLDVSGSMEYEVPNVIEAIASATTLPNLCVYASDAQMGHVVVAIKDGVGLPAKTIMESSSALGGENFADLPILQWFQETYSSYRRIWVSDTMCCRLYGDFESGSAEARSYCRRAGIEIAYESAAVRRLLSR